MTTQDPMNGKNPAPSNPNTSNPTPPPKPTANPAPDASITPDALPWLFDPQTGQPLTSDPQRARGENPASTGRTPRIPTGVQPRVSAREAPGSQNPNATPVQPIGRHSAGRRIPAPTANDPREPRTPRDGAAVSRTRKRVNVPLWFIVLVCVAIVTLLVAVIVLSVRACSLSSEPVTPATEQEWVSPYTWSNLKQLDNGFYAYYNGDGSLASEAGVDVSEHDGAIDWQAVKDAGADFAMIRLGYRGYSQGTMALDDYFLANIQGASAAGLKVGVYFFSQAITEEEAREEAQFVIDTLAGLGVTLSYPVAFDQEPITNGDVARTDNITNAQLMANALAFCQAIEQAGYQAMIYGNQHDLARLDLSGELSAYPLWYAEYDAPGDVPTGEFDFTMWQYTASGSVSGITTSDGQVDMNIRFLG